MFDAGICAEQAHQHSQYYSGIAHYLFDDDEYAKEPNESLAEQLKRLGYKCRKAVN